MTFTEMLIAKADDVKATPCAELEVSRLTEKLGEQFIVKIKALTLNEYDSMPKGDDMRLHTVLKGITSPDLKDETLRRAYTPKERKNPLTAKELCQKLFLVGEIANIASEILALSGFSEKAVKVVENMQELEDIAVADVLKN